MTETRQPNKKNANELTNETSAFESLHDGQFIYST